MLEAYHKLHPTPKSITELKEALHLIWDSLPEDLINKAVKSFILSLKSAQKLAVNISSTHSDVGTGGSGGSMNRGSWGPRSGATEKF